MLFARWRPWRGAPRAFSSVPTTVDNPFARSEFVREEATPKLQPICVVIRKQQEGTQEELDAAQLGAELQLPVLPEKYAGRRFMVGLYTQRKGLFLKEIVKGFAKESCDFVRLDKELSKLDLAASPLLRALDFASTRQQGTGNGWSVLDATAGFGLDAWLLAKVPLKKHCDLGFSFGGSVCLRLVAMSMYARG